MLDAALELNNELDVPVELDDAQCISMYMWMYRYVYVQNCQNSN